MPRGTATSNTICDSTTQVQGKTVVVNIFFDGTKNNLYNTDSKILAKTEVSFQNAYTNVAHLYKAGFNSNDEKWIYIEGIGTESGVKDNARGYGFGTGDYGIKARVAEAFNEIMTQVKSTPKILTLNVFGFSRGAAAARYFIHEAKSNPTRFSNWCLKKSQVMVNFVGLFDTVSSFAEGKSLNFNNDVQELHLNFEANYARKVFHLAALDEYRKNFSLTTIDSARTLEFGYEMYIPGAHSDVGGSYNNEWEKRCMDAGGGQKSAYYKWMVKQGWARENANPPQLFMSGIYGQSVWANRYVYNNYYKVPLRIMKDMAEEYGDISFSNINTATQVDRDREISSMLSSYSQHALDNAHWSGKKSVTRIILDDSDKSRWIRNTFFHLSADESFGLETRTRNGLPWRQPIPG